MDNIKLAIKVLNKQIDIGIKKFGKDNPKLRMPFFHLGKSHFALFEIKLALLALYQAKRICEIIGKKAYDILIHIIYELCKVYETCKEYPIALKYCKKCKVLISTNEIANKGILLNIDDDLRRLY